MYTIIDYKFTASTTNDLSADSLINILELTTTKGTINSITRYSYCLNGDTIEYKLN